MMGKVPAGFATRMAIVLSALAAGAVQAQSDGATRPKLSRQFAAQYSISSGDLDGDGRRDLMLRRLMPPQSADGTIGDVLLRQSNGGALVPVIPSTYALAVASDWPAAAVEIRTRDVNIDGYADLILRGISSLSGFADISNQIMFAPGASGDRKTPDLRAVDSLLTRFSRDIDRQLVDPAYYRDNAPLVYGSVSYYSFQCSWPGVSGAIDLEGLYSWPCYLEPIRFYVVYQDYSRYDENAMQIASADYGIINGYESPETGFPRIAEIIARVLGVELGGWDIGEVLGGSDIESEDEARGMELFAVLAGISEAVAQEAEEDTGNTNPDRVLLKGRRVLGRGPFHTALEYRYTTVSAYDSNPSPVFDGRLVSEVNWPPDHPTLTLRMGYVDGPTPPLTYWSSILAKDARYGDDLPYDLFPSIGKGGYNSNSFIAGMILATLGRPTVEMQTFVGGERPVPASEFN